MVWVSVVFFFFFQAEDGIRYSSVTGVQTCALPISVVSDVQHRRQALPERTEVPPLLAGQITHRARVRVGPGSSYARGRTRTRLHSRRFRPNTLEGGTWAR